MTVAEAIRAATERLSATSDTARLDAELLMAHVLGVARSDLLLRHMTNAEPEGFAPLVERRAEHEPVAHLLGHQEFYGLDLFVTRDALIPRGDSETLIEAAREAFADRAPPARILDLGTGTGALLLAALTVWPHAHGTGIDASPAAAMVGAANALRLGLDRRARMFERDWTQDKWDEGFGTFDLILANPPYVEAAAPLEPSVARFEPAAALFAGTEGLDAYRSIVPQLGKLLSAAGVAILEIGATQAVAVAAIAGESGFTATLRTDLAGRPRALVLA